MSSSASTPLLRGSACPTSAGLSRRHHGKVRAERIKLAASLMDRTATVVLSGGVLGPLFQDATPHWGAAWWIAGALLLHAFGQLTLGLLEDDA